MENRIPEEIIEEVRLRSDIVETISEYVNLKRKGKNYQGLCPFHAEDTPSFSVTPDKQMFYCFGCHVGGNVFSFLMKKENWTFLETVQHLARKNGVALPEKELSARELETQRRKKRWEEIHEWSAVFFHEVLLQRPEGKPGRMYMEQRGIDQQTIQDFRLGYAPDSWDGLLEYLKARGVSPGEIVEAGLALQRQNPGGESYYDRFRNRVIFSILDHRQRPVAFGGRVLDDSVPKYLNSPETLFFSKGHHLYGIHRAHQGIRAAGFALLVEGYMDVIAVQRAGFTQAVASLGTALTKDQARILRRYTERVVVAYDGDSAGIQATLRAGEVLIETGLRVDVLVLAGAKDPDEYLKKFDVASFRSLLDKPLTYIEFKYRTLVAAHSPRTIPEKGKIVRQLAGDIRRIASPVEREGYERLLSFELGITLESVQNEIASKEAGGEKKGREAEYYPGKQDISVKNRDNINRYAVEEVASVPQGVYRAERLILRIIWENRSLTDKVRAKLGDNFWRIPAHGDIYKVIEGNHASTDLNEDGQSVLADILLEDIDLVQPEKLLDDCIKGIANIQAEDSVENLQARMAELEKSGDMAGAMVLLREIGERLKRGEQG